MNKLNDVSLVIATYNEEKSIEFVLKEIENYDFHEIIIIDGNSTDSTKELASKFNTTVYNQTSRRYVWCFFLGPGIDPPILPCQRGF